MAKRYSLALMAVALVVFAGFFLKTQSSSAEAQQEQAQAQPASGEETASLQPGFWEYCRGGSQYKRFKAAEGDARAEEYCTCYVGYLTNRMDELPKPVLSSTLQSLYRYAHLECK